MITTGPAIILFAHGSRDPLWRQPIEAVAARLEAAGKSVRCAYLELQAPDLASAGAELVAAGATRLTVVPMFLGTGKHAREDLPLLVEALRAAHPHVEVRLQSPVGEHPDLLDALAKIAMA
jgi:sirohydrochlorin cobaltochelatase